MGGWMSVVGVRLLVIVGLLSIALGLTIYFVPTIVAVRQNHRNLLAIVLLNAFLGGTLIGWVVTLVWAVCREKGGA
jgi:hypothetical protein